LLQLKNNDRANKSQEIIFFAVRRNLWLLAEVAKYKFAFSGVPITSLGASLTLIPNCWFRQAQSKVWNFGLTCPKALALF